MSAPIPTTASDPALAPLPVVQRFWKKPSKASKPSKPSAPASSVTSGHSAPAAAAAVANTLPHRPPPHRVEGPPPPYTPPATTAAAASAPEPVSQSAPPEYSGVPAGAFDPRELTDFQLDELVHRIIGRITRLIRTELRMDRERIGRLRDPRH
ncbi:hypothetical protein CF54_06305 [Streptomyces sp. Tu 6176]|uniref:hypothetical protein n=1 Tax=Streptomyces sp. Tu 6176 TaxID=1470557 RepID=UPI000449FBFC|nr:hypothetical protein [Streptomyces sp. Tu 6176]EYT83616.1 hypothetical protein CF54_06305 [Streptomyces sp. Tu 6176]